MTVRFRAGDKRVLSVVEGCPADLAPMVFAKLRRKQSQPTNSIGRTRVITWRSGGSAIFHHDRQLNYLAPGLPITLHAVG